MKKFTVAACFAFLLQCTSNAQVTIIPFNDTWKYLDNGSNQSTAFTAPAFNDASWKTGTGKFGYGISDASTVISFGPDPAHKYATTYFRKTINISNPGAFAFFEASIKRDDGVLVFVNGTEVYRNNMGTGRIYSGYKAAAEATDNGTIGQLFTINSSLFVAGANTIAVEIHQRRLDLLETDMAFDFSLMSAGPTLTSVGIASNNATASLAKVGDIVSLSFTASEPINPPTVTIATKPATVTAGTGNSFTATYPMESGDASGIVPFTINFSSTGGTAGTPVTTTTNGSNVTFDKTLPSVVSINRQVPSTATTNATSVTFRATFSETVSGVNAPDFLFNITGDVTGTVSSVTPISGTVYDVTVTSITGNGTLRLDLNDDGTGIADAAGNAISSGFTAGQTYTINQTITTPTLTSVSLASNNATPSLAKVGDIVSLSFTASEPVNTPTVTIATKPATVTAGTDNSFTATYTMASGDASGIVPFTINFSSIGGTAGTQVTTTTNGSSVTFDKTIPTVVSINRQVPSSETTNVTSVTFRATFSEVVSGVDAPDFLFNITSGSVSGTVSSVNPVSGTVYDITVSSVTGNGTVRLDLKSSGTGIADAAGNAITAGFTTGQTYTINQSSPNQVTIIPFNDTWKYLDNGTNQSTAWRAPAFNDASWQTGTGKFGYGISDASTIISFGPNAASKYVTTYFRKTINISNPGAFAFFEASIKRDDGALVYVNGTEVHRSNMGTGTIYSGYKAATEATDNGTVGQLFTINSSLFVAGANTIAVEIHQRRIDLLETDMAFDFSLMSGPTGPTLTSVSLASNNATPSLAKVGDIISLSFTASEPINTPTVTIATKPATVTAGSGNSFTATYAMEIGDASGIVPFTINFSSTDGTAGTPVTTTTNGSSVTFDKTSPMVVSINRQVPSSATTNATSVIFRATYSETVSGVNVPDFLLTTTGGASGTVSSVNPVGGTIYDVTVASITGEGTLRLDLSSGGTGIADAAGNAISTGFTTGQAYTISQSAPPVPGFTSIIPLSPVDIKYQTKDKPQAKAWYYANQWWCCLSAAAGGTKIFRLDGTSWTAVLTLTSGGTKPDCWVSGDLVHVLLYNDDNALLHSAKYDVATNRYKLWDTRPTAVPFTVPSGSETATLVVDGSGRMWIASAGRTDVFVWWSDAPYSTWSAPITIATGVNDDDICALTVIPGQNKIGILWGNQTTKRFGFRTHADGTSVTSWTADELPGAQSALNVGKGFADDHMNIVAASDGTLYCALKTNYDHDNYPEGILLVRRPSGTWDNLYTITMEGTQAIVLLNEAQGKIKVVYTTATGGGNIVYRESDISNIAFGPEMMLMSGTLNYASSTHQTYNPDIVILATDETTTPYRAISVLASDATSSSSNQLIVTREAAVKSQTLSAERENPETILKAYPNPFNSSTNLRFKLKKAGYYAIEIFDSKGSELYTIDRGWAEAGQENIRNFNNGSLQSGLYIVSLKTINDVTTIKLFKQ